jgi:hypothetical protein
MKYLIAGIVVALAYLFIWSLCRAAGLCSREEEARESEEELMVELDSRSERICEAVILACLLVCLIVWPCVAG